MFAIRVFFTLGVVAHTSIVAGQDMLMKLHAPLPGTTEAIAFVDDQGCKREHGVVAISFPIGHQLRGDALNKLSPLRNTLLKLNLGLCDLSRTDFSTIAFFSELRSLSLSHTGVPDRALEHVASLELLRELDLTKTPVSDEGLRRLGQLSRLERLSLSHTRVSGSSLSGLRCLRGLKHIDLSHTRAGADAAAGLAECASLETLDLSNSRFENAHVAKLASLTALEDLRLGGCRLTGSGGFEAFRVGGSALLLDVPDTDVNDECIAPIIAMGRIRSLGVSGSLVTTEGVRRLKEIERLESLLVDSSQINAKIAAELRAACPELEIWVKDEFDRAPRRFIETQD